MKLSPGSTVYIGASVTAHTCHLVWKSTLLKQLQGLWGLQPPKRLDTALAGTATVLEP